MLTHELQHYGNRTWMVVTKRDGVTIIASVLPSRAAAEEHLAKQGPA
jgi:hypothetical protein